MSEFVHKPGSFSLFRNDKGDNPKRPDYTGEGMDLDGNAIEVAAWIKEGNKGKFMSASFKRKDARKETPKAEVKTDRGASGFDDLDTPF